MQRLGLDEEYRGSVVANIKANGPADKAGLKIYDVITEVDGQRVKNAQDLVDIISDKEPSKKIKIKYFRNNKGQAIEKTANATIEERPDEKKLLRDIFQQRKQTRWKKHSQDILFSNFHFINRYCDLNEISDFNP